MAKIALASVCLLACMPLHAAEWPGSNSLAGIKNFEVLIEQVDAGAESDALTAALKTDVESKLAAAGIPLRKEVSAAAYQRLKAEIGVLQKAGDKVNNTNDRALAAALADVQKAVQNATIYLNVNIVRLSPTSENYIFNVEVAVQQNALLDRDRKIPVIAATTWHRAALGASARTAMATTIRTMASDLTDDLLKDYQSENPPDKK